MAIYAYKARTYEGELITGQIDAPDRMTIERDLGNQGLIPISISEIKQRFDLKKYLSSLERVSGEDLIIFTRQLGTMYKAGIPFIRAITAVGQQTGSKSLRNILTQVKKDVEEGETFSKALAKHPHVFDELYISMVEAGEAAGVLDEILDRLSILLEKDAAIKSKIKSATLYPKIVIGAIIAAAMILITFVIPKFAALYGSFKTSLPLPTRILILISSYSQKYWLLAAFTAAASLISFRYFIKTEMGRRWWDTLRIRVPLFGPLALKAAMSRFSMILGTLLKSGLPIMTALEISGRTTGNIAVSSEIEKIRDEIRGGRPLADPMEDSGLFPAMMVQMASVGEETGKLDDMFLKVSEHLNNEVDYTVRNLSTLLEPVLLTVIFGMVLFLALALFLPMWDMVRLVRGGK